MKNQLINTLEQLETEMISCQLWDNNIPSPTALSSCEPFCVDTLRFEQWLQWVFIPKMREMLNSPDFDSFSHTSDIHTMSNYVFKDYQQDTVKINQIIKQLDDLINQF